MEIEVGDVYQPKGSARQCYIEKVRGRIVVVRWHDDGEEAIFAMGRFRHTFECVIAIRPGQLWRLRSHPDHVMMVFGVTGDVISIGKQDVGVQAHMGRVMFERAYERVP